MRLRKKEIKMKTERELFEEWHYGQYLLENPDVDLANAKYIYDYAHKNALVYQMRETCFIVWQASAQREGYKLVPVETLEECLSWAACASSESWSDEQRDEIDKHYKVIEKAMIGAAP